MVNKIFIFISLEMLHQAQPFPWIWIQIPDPLHYNGILPSLLSFQKLSQIQGKNSDNKCTKF